MCKIVKVMLALTAIANVDLNLTAARSGAIILFDFRKARDTIAQKFLFLAHFRSFRVRRQPVNSITAALFGAVMSCRSRHHLTIGNKNRLRRYHKQHPELTQEQLREWAYTTFGQ